MGGGRHAGRAGGGRFAPGGRGSYATAAGGGKVEPAPNAVGSEAAGEVPPTSLSAEQGQGGFVHGGRGRGMGGRFNSGRFAGRGDTFGNKTLVLNALAPAFAPTGDAPTTDSTPKVSGLVTDRGGRGDGWRGRGRSGGRSGGRVGRGGWAQGSAPVGNKTWVREEQPDTSSAPV